MCYSKLKQKCNTITMLRLWSMENIVPQRIHLLSAQQPEPQSILRTMGRLRWGRSDVLERLDLEDENEMENAN